MRVAGAAGLLPAWRTVYGLYQRWHDLGVTIALHDALRGGPPGSGPGHRADRGGDRFAVGAGRGDRAQSSRGWDNAKKVNGRKRHIAVDTTGLLLEILATPASVQDRDGARPLL